jgi:kynurenine formamidase
MANSWGRWGADDEAGALNRVGPEQVLRAVQLVHRGQVFSLGQPLGPETPVPGHRKKVERLMMRDGGDYAAGARRPGGFQFAEEVLGFAAHSGTHMDALSHAWYDDQLYNGYPSSSIRSTTGAAHCGAENLRPLVTRGVLLDVAAGRETPLDSGEVISLDALRAALANTGTELVSGDVVVIHTGWLARKGSDGHAYFAGEPGIDAAGAAWLAEAGVAAVGSDNYAIEVLPFPSDDVFPVHKLLLRDHGVPLIEGMVLGELAQAGATVFLFVAAAIPIVGGTAGPVCPIAVL